MSIWLVAIVGAIYFSVSTLQIIKGQYALGFMYLGYFIANIATWFMVK